MKSNKSNHANFIENAMNLNSLQKKGLCPWDSYNPNILKLAIHTNIKSFHLYFETTSMLILDNNRGFKRFKEFLNYVRIVA
jgi:hypothetical protein